MKCKAVKAKMCEYFEGEMEAAAATKMAAHLQGCAACRKEAAGFDEAVAALQVLATEVEAPEMSAALREQLRARRGRRPVWAWAAAAAAVLLLVYIWSGIEPTSQREPEARPVAQQPQGPPGPVTEEAMAEKPAFEPAQEAAPAPQEPAPSYAKSPQVPLTTEKRAPPPEAVVIEDLMIAEVPPAAVDLPPDKEAEGYTEAPPALEPEPQELVLILGEPRAPAGTSTYIAEVTRPDGSKSRLGQVIERDAAGKATAIRIACEDILPEDNDSQGG